MESKRAIPGFPQCTGPDPRGGAEWAEPCPTAQYECTGINTFSAGCRTHKISVE